MKRNINLHWFPYLLFIAFVLTMFGAWCVNIYKLVTGPFDITGEFVLRIIGIFVAPFGSVMGFM